MKLECFSLVDFSRSGGATIRISGMLNALGKKGVEIHFFSETEEVSELSESVTVIPLPENVLTIDKRKFQFLLAHFPVSFVNQVYRPQLNSLKKLFRKYRVQHPVLFFEYLDISIGYWLWKNEVIPSYIADVHGIAPLEFELNETNSFRQELMNKVKKVSSRILDKKVFAGAEKIIYPSEGVKNYLIKEYDLSAKKSLLVEESINPLLVDQQIDKKKIKQLQKKFDISVEDTIILFAGAFKQLGGVTDLVKAFIQLQTESALPAKLVLVGDGQLYEHCKELVEEAGLQNRVFFLGRQPYSLLPAFHKIADIIVCPDKDTEYSQILPHIKYFDSLVSGKIVINGNFAFMKNLNPNEKYSLNFEPSNVQSLKETLVSAIHHKKELSEKYALASKEAIQEFSYNKNVQDFLSYLAEL